MRSDIYFCLDLYINTFIKTTFQPIRSTQKMEIVNIYNSLKTDYPHITYRNVIKQVAEKSGVGVVSVQRIISEYKSTRTVKSPIMRKMRKSISDIIDDVDKNTIRQKVHTFWMNREFPTLQKIVTAVAEDDGLPTLKRTTMYRLLKELQFVFTRRRQNCILMDKEDLIVWRRKYLRNIQHFREEGKTIYYLGETWFKVNEEISTCVSNQVSKGEHLIAFHIGSDKGFVNGGLLVFEQKSNNADYSQQINGDIFLQWFIKILPLLEENAVIVMDNAAHHSLKQEKLPTSLSNKTEIIQWLISKNIKFDNTLLKAELLYLVKSHKKQYDKYIVDEIALAQNKTVLRLPPFHTDLNPIELAWSMVQGYVMESSNMTYNINNMKYLLINAISGITPQHWLTFIQHTMAEEQVFWDIDNIIDDMMETVDRTIFDIGNLSSSDSDEEDY